MSNVNRELKRGELGLWEVLMVSFTASPGGALLIVVLTICSAIIPTLQIVVFARFIDDTIAIVNDSLSLFTVAPTIIIIACFIAYQWLAGVVMKLLWRKLSLSISETYKITLVEKCGRIHYDYYDNADTHECITRVMKDLEKNIVGVFETLCEAFNLIVHVVGVMIVIMTHSLGTALLTLAVSIPLMFLAKKSGDAAYKLNRERTKHERQYTYLGNVLRNRETVLERTLFGYSLPLNEKWKEAYSRSAALEQKAIRDLYIKGETGSVLTALVSISSVAILLIPVVQGAMSIGIYIALVNACFTLIGEISWTLREIMENLAKHHGYIADMNTLLAFGEKRGATASLQKPVSFSSIRFEQVRFRYPNQSQDVLRDLSFEMKWGKHYALVGKNGSGKSTIIKLILGLYEGYEGNIYIDDIELRAMDPVEAKSLFATVFQDFSHYQISLRESLQLGSIEPLSEEEMSHILQSLQLNEFVDSLPQGLDTPLGRIMEGGRDISGGQWQRIAIARCAVNQAPIRILDEPTAALDPMMESQLYNDFSKISQQGMTILISHRLGSIKLADEILVLDQGRIIERGDHEALMARKGLYSEMYENQRSWYL